MRTRIKICGITRVDDAAMVVSAGVDAIGLVFASRSPRLVEVARAQEIAAVVPAFVQLVGLFLDPDEDDVHRVLEAVPIDVLQFHGKESPRFCRQFGQRYIKTVGLANLEQPEAVIAEYHDAAAILFDSHAHGEAGGTGRSMDWRYLPDVTHAPVILAGGLRPDNVAAAVETARPHAVDVSSGVESAPGVKDPDLVSEFINEVQGVDARQAS
jgi:phosphoribosylanthranilate isomerase